MPEVPSIWRVELYHPLVVHFPIVLLMSGTLAWIAGQAVSCEGRLGFLLPAGRLALVAGTAAAWLAVYTGDLADADSEVSRLVAVRGGIDLMPEQGTKPMNKYLPPRPRDRLDHAPETVARGTPVALDAKGFLGWLDRALDKI